MLTTGDAAGVPGAEGPQGETSIGAAESAVADPEALHRIAGASDRLLVTNVTGLLSGDAPTGTYVTEE
jgi:hypothetical protein